MVLKAAQDTSFFENPSQIEISHGTRIHLQSEGSDRPEHLSDFDEDSMFKISSNLMRLGKSVPDMTTRAFVGATIPTPLLTLKRNLICCS